MQTVRTVELGAARGKERNMVGKETALTRSYEDSTETAEE